MTQLSLSIQQAKDLAKAYANLICIIKVFADSSNKKPVAKWRSKAVKKSAAPVWNYEIADALKITASSAVSVSVWNKGAVGKDFVGEIWIDGQTILDKRVAEEWHALKSRANKSDKVAGEIFVAFKYSDDELDKKTALSAQIAKDKKHREELNLEQVITQIDMLDKLMFDEVFVTYRASLVGKEMVWLPRKVIKIDKENQTVTCSANDKEIIVAAANMRLGLTMNYLKVADKVLIKPAKKVVQNIQGLGEMTEKNDNSVYYLAQIERYNENGPCTVAYLEDEHKAKQTFSNIMELDCRLFIEPKQLVKNIFLAAKDNDLECVKKLIEAAKDLINSTNPVAPNFTPLAEAVNGSGVDTIRYLIEQGADPKLFFNSPKKNSTLLHIAVSSKPAIHENLSKVIELLVKAGVDINSQNEDGNTALHLAYAAKLELAIKTLLDLGANTQIKNAAGWVPDVEKQKNEYQSAKETIWGNLSNAKQLELFFTENASKFDFKFLLNPNHAVTWSILPLAASLIQGHKDTANLLVKHGASSEEALLVLCQQCRLEAIESLFEIAPTVNVNYQSDTFMGTISPLSSALKANNYSVPDLALTAEQFIELKRKVVSFLFKKGADPKLPCGDSRNAFEVVRQLDLNEYTALIELFKAPENAPFIKPRLSEEAVPLKSPIVIKDIKTEVLELSRFLPQNMKIPEFAPESSEKKDAEGKCGRVSATVSNAFLSSHRSKLDFICKTITANHILYFYSISFELHQSEDGCEISRISMANAPTFEYGTQGLDERQKVVLTVEWSESDSLSNVRKHFKLSIEVTADLTTMSFGRPIPLDPSFSVGPVKVTVYKK